MASPFSLVLRAVRIPLHEVAAGALAARIGVAPSTSVASLAEKAMGLLDEKDRRRLMTKVRPQDQLRGALSALLLKEAAGSDANIERHPRGRPMVVSKDSRASRTIDVNCSHHGQFVVCGTVERRGEANGSSWRRIGVDVVSLRELPRPEGLKAFARYLSPAEMADIEALEPSSPSSPSSFPAAPSFELGFGMVWSMKEAMVKALGCGIAGAPQKKATGGEAAARSELVDLSFVPPNSTDSATASNESYLSRCSESFLMATPAGIEEGAGEVCLKPFWRPQVFLGPRPLPQWSFACYRLGHDHLLSIALLRPNPAAEASLQQQPWHSTPVDHHDALSGRSDGGLPDGSDSVGLAAAGDDEIDIESLRFECWSADAFLLEASSARR